MYHWTSDLETPKHHFGNLIIFTCAAASALILFFVLHPNITQITTDSPILIDIMYGPIFAVGFIYGLKIVERAIIPSEPRGYLKRTFVKIFLLFFVIGGLFSSVNFALQGGTVVPQASLLDDGLIPWASEFVTNNGGITFLIVSSITIMAAATKIIVRLDGGVITRMITFVGTFFFFSMIALSLTNTDPTDSQVYLYVFYQAGIISGALYQMNKRTSTLNMWEDFANGYK
jgi:hypothetical protein